MKFKINQAVNIALHILMRNLTNGCEFKPYMNLIFPEQILALQDSTCFDYCVSINKLLFPPRVRSSDKLKWQLKQLYRSLNAACDSVHITMSVAKLELNQLRLEIEATQQIQKWLRKLDKAMPRELICVGHGFAVIENGPVKDFNQCELVVYAPVGSMTGYSLATAIENSVFDKDKIYLTNEKENALFAPTDYEYPKRYSGSNGEMVPDYLLTSDCEFKSRVVEKCSGRIVLDPKVNILVSEVMKQFPGSVVHWAACYSVRSKVNNAWLTPNAEYIVKKRKVFADYPPCEPTLRRIRLLKQKHTFDQKFSLFQPSQPQNLNPKVVEEMQRLNIPIPKI